LPTLITDTIGCILICRMVLLNTFCKLSLRTKKKQSTILCRTVVICSRKSAVSDVLRFDLKLEEWRCDLRSWIYVWDLLGEIGNLTARALCAMTGICFEISFEITTWRDAEHGSRCRAVEHGGNGRFAHAGRDASRCGALRRRRCGVAATHRIRYGRARIRCACTCPMHLWCATIKKTNAASKSRAKRSVSEAYRRGTNEMNIGRTTDRSTNVISR